MISAELIFFIAIVFAVLSSLVIVIRARNIDPNANIVLVGEPYTVSSDDY